MPLPFEKVFKRPGLRRILLPLTVALLLFGFAAFLIAGT